MDDTTMAPRAADPEKRSTSRDLPVTPLAALFLAVAVLAGIWNYAAGQVAQAEAKRQRTLVIRSDRLLSTMKDLEIGERGYALTGKSEYLDPYIAALPRIARQLDDIDALGQETPDGPVAALRPMRELVGQEQAFFDTVITTRRDRGAEAATSLVSTGRGRRLMDDIQAAKAESDERASVKMVHVEASDRTRSLWLNGLVVICGGVAVALLARLSLVRRRESQRSRKTLEDVLGNAPVGLGFLDAHLHIQQMNRTLAEMADGLGIGVGHALWASQPDVEERIRPALEAALERCTATTGIDVPFADSSVAGGTRHLRMGFYPLDGSDAGDGRVGVAVVDLTDARLSEERVRAGEATLRTVLNTLPVGVLIAAAPSGRIVDHNARAEAILGHGVMPAKPGEGVARWVGFHADGRPVQLGEWPIVRVTRGEEPLAELEVDYQRGDGRRAWIDFTGAPMRDAAGRLTGGVVVVSDIDARKRSEQDLAAARDAAEGASRAKSAFLANMSHELRTPLSAIIGYSEMLREEIDDGAEAGDLSSDVGRIEGNARHLLGLINDVLDLSKIESGKMEVFAETFAVEPVVRDLAATVGSLVARKGNRLELRVGPDLGEAHTDLTKVRQVLLNLVGNAAKFTENGTVTFSASRRAVEGAASLVFAVSDTGIGMTSEQVSKLFERFAQADASTTRKFGGTGLGLSLTRAFADMLGGTVEVESEPGRGSTFTFSVPVDHRAAENAPEAAGSEVMQAPADGRDLVLVIDDDADQRTLLSRFLERDGFAARAAPDGRSGLDLARRLRPRAILLDVMMPGVDGWSVLSELKADPDLADTPVVMVSSTDEKGLAATLGAADYMLKPVRWDRMAQLMERFRTHGSGVLLVEDDVVLRGDFRDLLEDDGWTVVEAGDGREALREAAARRPEVVLVDLNMPVMDGFDFLRELRALPGCAETPVVVMTGRELTQEDRGLLRGASQILNTGDVSMVGLGERLRGLTKRT